MHRPIVKSYKQYYIANQGNRLTNRYSFGQSEILLAKASVFLVFQFY